MSLNQTLKKKTKKKVGEGAIGSFVLQEKKNK